MNVSDWTHSSLYWLANFIFQSVMLYLLMYFELILIKDIFLLFHTLTAMCSFLWHVFHIMYYSYLMPSPIGDCWCCYSNMEGGQFLVFLLTVHLSNLIPILILSTYLCPYHSLVFLSLIFPSNMTSTLLLYFTSYGFAISACLYITELSKCIFI